jgi:hypothetical protein
MHFFPTVIDNLDLFELIRLQCLLAHTAGSNIEVITVMVAYAHITISAGDPIPFVRFYQRVTYCF